jgi:hypothetical protein
MTKPVPIFVIPTYRLRDVGATVEAYDQHFHRNGHHLDLVVFDDSSSVNQEKYFPILERIQTCNPLFYVGPREKEQFLGYLFGRLSDRKLEPLVRNLFRPSYGGKRNYTLMYRTVDASTPQDVCSRSGILECTQPGVERLCWGPMRAPGPARTRMRATAVSRMRIRCCASRPRLPLPKPIPGNWR